MIVPLFSERDHLPIEVSAYRFSASGDGKSQCDGYAAILKQQVKKWIKTGLGGHNTRTPIQFAEALVRFAPVANVLVMSGHIKNAKKVIDKNSKQISKISFYNDFEYSKEGVTVRKQTGMGKGLFIPLKKIRQPAQFVGKIILSKSSVEINDRLDDALCLPEKTVAHKLKETGVEVEDAGLGDGLVDESKSSVEVRSYRRQGQLYLCSLDICEASFISLAGLQDHIRENVHVVRTRKRSTTNEFKYRWFTKYGMTQSERIPNIIKFLTIIVKISDK